jgi:hypothetical protein
VWWLSRNEDLCYLGIVDARTLLLDPKLIHGPVRFLVMQIVLVVSKPITEPAVGLIYVSAREAFNISKAYPKLLEELLTFFGSVFECLALAEVVEESVLH